MTGEVVDAARAEQIGLVTEVVAHERLLDRALELAGQIAEVPGPTMLGLKEIYTTGAAAGDRSRRWPPRRRSPSRSTAISRDWATSSARLSSATSSRSSAEQHAKGPDTPKYRSGLLRLLAELAR